MIKKIDENYPRMPSQGVFGALKPNLDPKFGIFASKVGPDIEILLSAFGEN